MVCDKHVIAKDLLEKKTNNMRLAREKKKRKINEFLTVKIRVKWNLNCPRAYGIVRVPIFFSIQLQVSNLTSIRSPRENNETEGKSEGVGRDTWISLKLFLEVVINSCDVRTF